MTAMNTGGGGTVGFEPKDAERAIARAAKVAQTPVAIHAYEAGRESARVAGCGACAEACAFVHTLPWGPQACRRSREKAGKTALKRGRPVPYLCHMGFACVAAPVLPGKDDQHVATFGPYCPAETPDALQLDARAGLQRLERMEREELPFSLADIARVPAEIVPEVAEWLGETLLKQTGDSDDGRLGNSLAMAGRGTALEQDSAGPVQQVSSRNRRATRSSVVRDAFGARSILAAMAGADPAAFREAIRNQLTVPGPRLSPHKLRARSVAITSAVVEAAGQAAEVLDTLSGRMEEVDSTSAAIDAIARALAPLRRDLLAGTEGSTGFYAAVERYVEARLTESLTLDAIARHFRLPPSTLTRRLQRRYGLTFTGYVARRRVERAKTLLSRSDLSVDAVADRVGLTDGAHLRKLLRRFEGNTPSDLRKAR